MEFRTMFLERLDAGGLAVPCEPRRPAIAERARELQSTAEAQGLAPEGQPFVQLCGAFVAFVHLATDGGTAAGDPGTFRIPGGWVAVTPGVSFGDARAVGREIGAAMADQWSVNGPAEFHPEGPDFERGALVLPVRPTTAASPRPAVLASRLLVTAIPGA